MTLAKLVRNDTLLILLAVALGIALGALRPELGVRMKPLSDAFLAVIGHTVPLIMFVLVASAIAGFGRHGRRLQVAGRVIPYFLLMTLLSLAFGVAAALLLAPGAGRDLVSLTSPPQAASVLPAGTAGLLQFFGHSPILAVLLAALLFGLLLAWLGDRAGTLRCGLDKLTDWLLYALRLVLRVAPVAAFGAMAYTVGRYGPTAAWPLLKFVGTLYLAALGFIILVLGLAARCAGFGLLRLLAYLRAELCLVAFTGASVAALPGLLAKLERAGCGPRLVRLVLSTGYTFNLAGSNLYVTCAVLFLAQLSGITLDGSELLALLSIGLLTSLGSTSAAGSAFLTLTATLGLLNLVPLEGLGVLLGVERLMKCRSLTNVIGNSVACVVISAWSGELDRQALHEALAHPGQEGLPGASAGKH